jgi:hypothetical protein
MRTTSAAQENGPFPWQKKHRLESFEKTLPEPFGGVLFLCKENWEMKEKTEENRINPSFVKVFSLTAMPDLAIISLLWCR